MNSTSSIKEAISGLHFERMNFSLNAEDWLQLMPETILEKIAVAAEETKNHSLLTWIDNAMIMKEMDLDMVLSSLVFRYLVFVAFAATVVYIFFHPFVKMTSRPLLRKYAGAQFGDMRLSLLTLSFTMEDIEVLPLKSPILLPIFSALFPSAVAKSLEKSERYPESTLAVKHLEVKLRTNESESTEKEISWISRLFRPIVVITMDGVTLEVEKSYIAPEPPTEFRSTMQQLRQHSQSASLSPAERQKNEIPTFDQDYYLDFLRSEEWMEADRVTFCVERWIHHVVTKIRQKPRRSYNKTSSNDSFESTDQCGETAAEQTEDEKKNALIQTVVAFLCHSVSVQMNNASILISGAGSDFVKSIRQQHNPHDANLLLAKVPRKERSLTAVGANAISISFSPDSECNLLFCFVGLQVKVGDPIPSQMAKYYEEIDDQCDIVVAEEIQYAWQVVVHPFQVVLEISGVMPFMIWILNYDHYWETRSIGLNLSSSEVAVALAPTHIHTIFLHLDDWTDPNSAFNDWFSRIRDSLHRTFVTSEREKTIYCQNYAKTKGLKCDEFTHESSSTGAFEMLTPAQMKDLEMRMTRYEIMSLRCLAMRDVWHIPKECHDFSDFLRDSLSSIGDNHNATSTSTTDSLSPFQRNYSSPLEALVSLIRIKSTLLAVPIRLSFLGQTIFIDFPDTRTNEEPRKHASPSSAAVSNICFDVKLSNPLFSIEKNDAERHHGQFLDLSLQIRDVKWRVVEPRERHIDVSVFHDGYPVGILYKHNEAAMDQSHLISAKFSTALAPTKEQEPHFSVSFHSSNAVIVLNAIPILTSIQTLIDLSDLPFSSVMVGDEDQILKASPLRDTSQHSIGSVIASRQPDNIFSFSTKMVFIVENTSILFMIDRSDILRGVLDLRVDRIKLTFESVGMSGELAILPEPCTLCAGQIVDNGNHRSDESIHWRLMPFKPIMRVEGARLTTSFEKKERATDGISPLRLGTEINIGVESFEFNASPSTSVALIGVVESLNPFWGGSYEERRAQEQERANIEKQKEEDMKRANLQFQREALRKIFNIADLDASGTLQEEELEMVLLMLFDENIRSGNNAANIINNAQSLTHTELTRERNFFISLVDMHMTNDVRFRDLDAFIYRMTQKIDDNNLIQNVGPDFDKFLNADTFLSPLRQIVYFDDLREYSSLHEVFRITGFADLEGKSTFPSPSLWRHGKGIDLFWELFIRETGCSRSCLNGQRVSWVQRKLVRSLCNYEFAKFCWKSIVQPALNTYENSAPMLGTSTTVWLLDKDPRSRISDGVIDRLLRRVDIMSKASREASESKSSFKIPQFDVSLLVAIDRASVKFGSSHAFTNPLLEFSFSEIGLSLTALLSEKGWFIPEEEASMLENGFRSSSDDQTDREGANTIQFRTNLSIYYLNTKHDHMECLVEPYPCFGYMDYKLFVHDSITQYGEDSETSSFSVIVNCPRFFNVNASPSFFEAYSLISKVLAESDPTAYRRMMQERETNIMHGIWKARTESDSEMLNRQQARAVLQSTSDFLLTDVSVGLGAEEKEDLITSILNDADKGGMISFNNLRHALRPYASRCYFFGCKEIQLTNNIGRSIKVSLTEHVEKYRTQHPHMSGVELEALLETFQNVDAGFSAGIPLKENYVQYRLIPHESMGSLSFAVEGYKLLDDVAISPYQPMMFPVTRVKSRRRRKGKKQVRNASGFLPLLTVVPRSNLDSISLDVRTSVDVRTETPIKIRIVRLPKSLGYLRKRGTKSQIDLTKKNFGAALKRLVKGSSIVHEKLVSQVENDPVPLDILESSHYHAILIQDVTGDECNDWRNPVLLTKEFLFNQRSNSEVQRCHALSGIIVHKNRLNTHISSKHHNQSLDGDTKKSILRRTSWDTTIEIIPSFILSNSLPFPIMVRAWQFSEVDVDDLWQDPSLMTTEELEEEFSSDEENSTKTPSLKGRGMFSELFHSPSETGQSDYDSLHEVAGGATLRLNGISLQQPLFMQVSQQVKVSGGKQVECIMWSNPLRLNLPKLRTGINRKGSLSLPKMLLNLGDFCAALVDLSIEKGMSSPICNLFAPYWIINRTGCKLEYKIFGQSKQYVDSGVGGLPIMTHTSKSSKLYQNPSKEITVIPLECPKQSLASVWWDAECNGRLVLKSPLINKRGHHNVAWSEKVELDAAGTSGEIHCNQFVFSVRIESMAGIFHRCKALYISPRYILKNMLHIPISIFPLSGHQTDAIRKARQLRKNQTSYDMSSKVDLAPGESTIIYNFVDISLSPGIEQKHYYVAFCVNAKRIGAYKSKYHLVRVDKIGTECHFGEHDGHHDTMAGIINVKVHASDGSSIVTSITHTKIPPFRIENRSNTHYLQLVQDDDEAVVFELPPMHSVGYTWDSPLGTRKLRAVVIPKSESRKYQLEETLNVDYNNVEGLENEGKSKAIFLDSLDGSSSGNYSLDSENGVTASSRCNGHHKICEISHHSSSSSTKKPSFKQKEKLSYIRELNRMPWWKRRWLYGISSRTYNLTKVGRKKDLPCVSHTIDDSSAIMSSMTMSSNLVVHMRILAGTKILSFSDSTWLAEQVELGLLKKGGDFKSAVAKVNIDGMGLYLMDEFPRELVGFVARDIQINKPMGSIEASASVRHFQVDAMLPDARYPIIVQPLPLGVDRRESSNSQNLPGLENVSKKECFWTKYDEKPVPIFEVTCSYVPQANMMWIPNIDVFISPMKIQIDVDYIMQIASTVVNATVSKFNQNRDAGENQAVANRTNSELKYVTRGQMSTCLTYIEKLNIAPVWFEIELNIMPDELDRDASNVAEESALTLNSIARNTNSAAVAGILSWIINVGANFAHVSPSFHFNPIIEHDRYCDMLELVKDIAISYIVQSIKQSYKVVFSMNLLGDPTLLAHQYKTGIRDLIITTRDELKAEGKEGFGRGVASFFQHVVGGTFFATGKVTGGMAKTLQSVTKNKYTSNHLKPKSASSRKRPSNAADGFAQGTEYFFRTMVHGIAGLVGNPYRGAQTGKVSGVMKGFASGVGGLVVSPLVGALGFMAKTSDGIGETTKVLELGVIEARCRPARIVPWGRAMVESRLPFLKAIGIRIHTVRYQKLRRKVDKEESVGIIEDWQTSKEFKRKIAAEERRKNPPSKVVSITYEKKNQSYITAATKPKLLSDHPGNHALSHYAVTFEESIVLRSSDMQLSDEVTIYFRNNKMMKTPSSTNKPLAFCRLTVGDMYSQIFNFYRMQLLRKEANLSEGIIKSSKDLTDQGVKAQSVSKSTRSRSLIMPAPQQFSLFRPCKKGKPFSGDVFEAIGEEMSSIQKQEEELRYTADSDSLYSDSDSSFLENDVGKLKDKSMSAAVKANERLFGHISISCFPIPW